MAKALSHAHHAARHKISGGQHGIDQQQRAGGHAQRLGEGVKVFACAHYVAVAAGGAQAAASGRGHTIACPGLGTRDGQGGIGRAQGLIGNVMEKQKVGKGLAAADGSGGIACGTAEGAGTGDLRLAGQGRRGQALRPRAGGSGLVDIWQSRRRQSLRPRAGGGGLIYVRQSGRGQRLCLRCGGGRLVEHHGQGLLSGLNGCGCAMGRACTILCRGPAGVRGNLCPIHGACGFFGRNML